MYALIVNSFVPTFCLDLKPGIHKCKITARLTLGIVSNVLSPGDNTRPLPLYKFQIVFDTKYLEIFILFATCKKLGPNYLHKHVLRLAKLTLILFMFEWIYSYWTFSQFWTIADSHAFLSPLDVSETAFTLAYKILYPQTQTTWFLLCNF